MAASRNSPSADLPAALRACLAARLASGRRVCVGLSGGRDSVALLHALAALRDAADNPLAVDLSAIHVHHGLSPHADRWTAFCADFCRTLHVPLQVERVAVAGDSGEGLEASARRARYAAYARCAADWLVLAHHRDDQAETLLLNLLRGAGSDGLAAMPAERPLAGAGSVRVLRPLLGVPRAAIEQWAETHRLTWVEDESNADTALRRNFLRREILPRLTTLFPAAPRLLAATAAHMGEMGELLAEVAAADRAIVADEGAIRVERFNALSSSRRANLLRQEIRRHGLRPPDARYLGEMLRQLAMAGSDAAPRFALDGGLVAVYRGGLYVAPALAGGGACVWHGEEELPWAGGTLRLTPQLGGGLSRARLAAAAVRIAVRSGGESFRNDAARPRRTLKKHFQETAIPPWWRECLPLLWCGDELVWVAGLGADPRYLAAPGEAAVLPAWSLLPTPLRC